MIKLYVPDCEALYTQLTCETQTYAILSGGFGSSPYVRQRLLEKFEPDNQIHSNAKGMQILVADEPYVTQT